MAEPIGALRAEMSVGVAQFASDMGRARQAVESNAKGMSRGMEMAKRGFEHTVKALKVMSLAAVAAGGALAVMVKQQIDAADAAAKTAQKAGTTVEVLTAMQHAANLAGVSNEALSQSMIKVAKYASDAARGTGDARHAYNALGISVTDATGKLKPSEQLMMEVADKFAQMEDGAGKTALAVKLFGRSGAELIPMLNAGSAGINDMMAEAKALGLVLDTETAQAAERFNDNLTRLNGVKKGFVNQIMMAVLPTLETLSDKMVDTAKNTSVLEGAGKAASVGLKVLASVATVVFKVFEQGGKLIGGVAAGIYAFATGRFREAYEIMKSVGSDYVSAFGDAAKTIEDIWTATDKHVGEKTESIKKKVSAPTIGLKDEAKEVAKATEEARSAADKYLDTLEDQLATFGKSANEIILYRMELEGAEKDQIEWAKAIIKTIEELEAQKKPLDEFTETAVDKFKELKDAIEGWGQDSTNALVDFATTGKQSFGDMIDSMIKDLMRMVIQQQIMGPMFRGISSLVGGMFTANAHGNAFLNGAITPFARGGVVNRPTIFPMARGMGLMGEAGAEAVMPLTRLPGGDLGVRSAGGGVVVNVHNHNKSDIKTESREGPQGMEIDVIVDQMVAQKLGQSTSHSNRVMRQNFGTREGLINR